MRKAGMIYLDNAATERMNLDTAAIVTKYSCDLFYNPGGRGRVNGAVMDGIGAARSVLAGVLGCAAGEITFLSCATEANNLVLRSAVKRHGQRIVISAGEHASVYNTAKALADKYDVCIVPLDKSGKIDEGKLLKAVEGGAALVSVIHVNNETGVINDINALSAKVKAACPDCLFHSDGVQAFCKLPCRLSENVDFYTVSAHKIGGPKGTGALFIKSGIKLNPIITGGKQEKNLRAGTENVPGIAAFGTCAAERSASFKRDFDNAAAVNAIFTEAFSRLPEVSFNGAYIGGKADIAHNSPYIMSVSFKGIKAEVLAALCEEKGVIIGLGSACSASYTDNRVLTSMGISKAYVEGSIRLSFSNETTEEDAAAAARVIADAVKTLRRI